MYHLYVDEDEPGVWEHGVFTELARYLSDGHGHVVTRNVKTFETRRVLKGPPVDLRHNLAVLQHRASRRYWVLDANDWVTPFTTAIGDFTRDFRCQSVLKSQYQRYPYRDKPLTKVRPWTYFETHPSPFQAKLDEYRKIPKTREPLFFRGNVSWAGRRRILECLAAEALVNTTFDQPVSYDDYARELAAHRIALALEGMGHLCHREIEAFGIGTPVLMPELDIELHEPLLPDVHYISVDTNIHRQPPEVVAEQLRRRYEQVENDAAYLDRIAANAMRWYERNVRMPASLALTVRLMGIR